MSLPLCPDPSDAAFPLFADDGIPRTVLLAPDGTVHALVSGYSEPDFAALAGALDDLLPAG